METRFCAPRSLIKTVNLEKKLLFILMIKKPVAESVTSWTRFLAHMTTIGKTYTMQGTDEILSLMPLTMSAVLTLCRSTTNTAEMSYYEVYMDRCYDLLEVKAKEIAILDDKDGQIHLKGLSHVPISSMSEFYEVFSRGIQRRKVAHVGLNDVSSRSHGVLVISISTPCDDGSGAVITWKLNLIDLAGNEDNRRTYNEGIRLQESAKINQSLFVLSNVIYALNNNKPRVPYRENKLTWILQDSLGRTSRALMVACLNPGEYQEYVHMVNLAARSRHISNSVPSAQKQDTPNVKVDMEAKLRACLESKGKTKSAQRMRAFGSPLMRKAPSSLSSLKKPCPCHSSTKAKAITNQGASNAKERVLSVQHINLFYNGDSVDSGTERFNFAAENNTNNTEEEFKAGGDGSASETNTILPDDALANDKKILKLIEEFFYFEGLSICSTDWYSLEQLARGLKSFGLKTTFEDVFPVGATSVKEYLYLLQLSRVLMIVWALRHLVVLTKLIFLNEIGNTSQIVTEHTIFDHKWRLVFNKSETPESDSTILTKEHFSEI
ncbi:Kinesin-like protein KIN-10B [Vitis vinifera]|uniref:Kinesin-like protein KIN-10B n=1 Tax=Vitis vinifera TaxID=29760 RepID=A0A438FUP4_VITVI|nr:Kinesin-like protein KIN-10B [Vitis vinifera]